MADCESSSRITVFGRNLAVKDLPPDPVIQLGEYPVNTISRTLLSAPIRVIGRREALWRRQSSKSQPSNAVMMTDAVMPLRCRFFAMLSFCR